MSVNFYLEKAKALMATVPTWTPRANVEFRDLLLLLREPSAVFGDPCDEEVVIVPNSRRPDWDHVLHVLYRTTTAVHLRSSHVLEVLQIAAEVLRESGHRILHGNPAELEIVLDEDYGLEQGVEYGLRIDAEDSQAYELTRILVDRLIAHDLSRGALHFSFIGAERAESGMAPEGEGGRHVRTEP
jgi:hypothetical protein